MTPTTGLLPPHPQHAPPQQMRQLYQAKKAKGHSLIQPIFLHLPSACTHAQRRSLFRKKIIIKGRDMYFLPGSLPPADSANPGRGTRNSSLSSKCISNYNYTISNYTYELPLKPSPSRTFTVLMPAQSKRLMRTLLTGRDLRVQKAQRQSKQTQTLTDTQTWHTGH